MIIKAKDNTVQTSGVITSLTTGIKQTGMAVIANLLRSQIYEDEILATIRETVCNSYDANVEAGNGSIPVQVTLPSRFNPVFKTRDFGKGLSNADMENIYMWFGESTKRESNDFTGCLGIGRFAPLSYTGNFVVTSYVNGTKNVFNVYIDSTDNNQISQMHSEPTTERNGVEISVAVKDADIQTFHDRAATLFQYFKVKPEVLGGDFKYAERKAILEGKGWAIYSGESSVAVMGNVGYPIDPVHFEKNLALKSAIDTGIEVHFSIGELEVSASREGLKYNDSTKKALQTKLNAVIKEVTKILSEKFDNCATIFDARKLYGQVWDCANGLYSLRNMVNGGIDFKGHKISSSTIHFNAPTDGAWTIRSYSKSGRGSKIISSVENRILCDEKTYLILNDSHIRSGITNRVYTAVNSDKRVYVLTYRDTTAEAAMFAETELVAGNCVLMSLLPKVSLAAIGGANGSSGLYKSSKHASKEFVYDLSFANNHSSWKTKKSDWWKQESVDVANDAGVYVMIDTFHYEDAKGNTCNPCNLKEILNPLAKLGIKIDKLFGFKANHEAKVKANPNMVSLWKFLETELTKYFAANNVEQKVANRLEYDANKGNTFIDFIEKHGASCDKNSVAYKTMEIFAHMKCEADHKILDACVAWKQYVKTAKPEHELSEVIDDFKKKYPLMPSVDRWEMSSGRLNKHLLAYIAMVG